MTIVFASDIEWMNKDERWKWSECRNFLCISYVWNICTVYTVKLYFIINVIGVVGLCVRTRYLQTQTHTETHTIMPMTIVTAPFGSTIKILIAMMFACYKSQIYIFIVCVCLCVFIHLQRMSILVYGYAHNNLTREIFSPIYTFIVRTFVHWSIYSHIVQTLSLMNKLFSWS